MKKIDLGQAVNALANLGVIAGIVFLAVELGQNNEFLRAQANYNVLQNRTAIFIPALIQDDTLARLLAKYERGEELEDYEVLQLNTFRRWHLTNWEWEYREFVAGRLSQEDLPVYSWREAMHVGIPANFGLTEFWEDVRETYAEDFVEFMDENVVRPGFP